MGPQREPESGENPQPFIRDAVSQLPGRMCHLRACVPPFRSRLRTILNHLTRQPVKLAYLRRDANRNGYCS